MLKKILIILSCLVCLVCFVSTNAWEMQLSTTPDPNRYSAPSAAPPSPFPVSPSARLGVKDIRPGDTKEIINLEKQHPDSFSFSIEQKQFALSEDSRLKAIKEQHSK